MTTGYEWDIETWCGDEIVDHNHRDRLSEFKMEELINAINNDGVATNFTRLVLVRTVDGGDRLWAYITDEGKLPEYFRDARDSETGVKVPKRFHQEFNL